MPAEALHILRASLFRLILRRDPPFPACMQGMRRCTAASAAAGAQRLALCSPLAAARRSPRLSHTAYMQCCVQRGRLQGAFSRGNQRRRHFHLTAEGRLSGSHSHTSRPGKGQRRRWRPRWLHCQTPWPVEGQGGAWAEAPGPCGGHHN